MKLRTLAILAIMFMIAVPTFAQAPGSASSTGTFVLPVAFAMAIASGLCGLAQGKAIASAAEGIARNPGAAGAIRILLLLGLAFIESLSLFTLITVLK
jgi:F-type H+-transporting ATPase subunit c